MSGLRLSRRGLVTAGAASVGGLFVTGCDRLSQAPPFQRFLGSATTLTYQSQRLLEAGQPLAREYAPRDMSPTFKANGTTLPTSDAYQALMAGGFKDWRLTVDGLVSHPLSLSLAQLKALPQRSQITRHDCVEGWSAIGKWTGPQLSRVLLAAGMSPRARYVVFHCADDLDGSSDGSGLYYESIDLAGAFHPQTILAHAMNDQPLEVAHGAPMRVRIERQLGYKQPKYVMRIQVADSLAGLGQGRGGYWEDRGYQWYGGI